MPIEVTMPKLSDTMEEGKILRWLKQVGDQVSPGDLLAEVETDKADMEVEAVDSGVLSEIRAAEGDIIPVGGVMAVIAGQSEQPRGAAKPAPEGAVAGASAPGMKAVKAAAASETAGST